jgi:hypothetical protein
VPETRLREGAAAARERWQVDVASSWVEAIGEERQRVEREMLCDRERIGVSAPRTAGSPVELAECESRERAVSDVQSESDRPPARPPRDRLAE